MGYVLEFLRSRVWQWTWHMLEFRLNGNCSEDAEFLIVVFMALPSSSFLTAVRLIHLCLSCSFNLHFTNHH